MSTQHTPGPWVPEYMGDVNGVRMSWLVKDKLSIGTRNPADEALTSAAPDMLAALTELADVFAHDGENSVARFDRLAAMFRKDTGHTAPGKDAVAGAVSQADRDGLNAIYDAWYLAKVIRARDAIAKATGAA